MKTYMVKPMKIWTAWLLCVSMLLGGGAAAQAEEAQNTEALIEVEYKKSDLDAEWNENKAVKIQLSGNGARVSGKGAAMVGYVLLIDQEGDYVLSGELNGRILIDAGKKDKVRLVFNGVNIVSPDSAAVFAAKADKVTITLAEGTVNNVTSGSKLIEYDDEELEAAIYSKADLVINGEGSLTVQSERYHGILSKDDLRVISGGISVQAGQDGVRGRDAVQMYGGTLTVSAGNDGVKSNNDEDDEKGYISVDGGSLTVSAGDDGVKAETYLQIRGGEVNVMQSYEGLEAQYMLISGGTVSVVSSDDGLNAAGGEQEEDMGYRRGFSAGHQSLRISGGTVYVDASGDGIDSNGTIEFAGGEVYVSGPVGDGNGALDSDSTMMLSGGVLLAAGSSGMASAPSSDVQAVTLVFAGTEQRGGERVSVRNAAGEELAAFTPNKNWSSIVVSLPTLIEGESFEIYVGAEKAITATAGESSGRGGWNPGGRPHRR